MRKVLVIAAREYRAAVRTRAFLISLCLMPVLMGGSFLIQMVFKQLDDTTEKRVAVLDRTPGGQVFPFLEKAMERRNQYLIFDPDTGKQTQPVFRLERIEPSADDPDKVKEQRFELSRRVQDGEFYGFLDIGPDVYAYSDTPPAEPNQPINDRAAVRFQSNHATNRAFYPWADRVVNQAVQQHRFAEANVPQGKVQAIQQTVPLRVKGLSKRNKETGAVEDPSDESQIANLIVPALLIMLMFMLVMTGATPPMQGVVEEKMQRIAEVLLGSVRPFELMLGKLVGMVGVSLTVVAVYLTGSYLAAARSGYTEFIPGWLLAWFVVYQVLAVLMYGSLFIAIGAAVTDMKETQGLLMPVMVVAMLPLFLLLPIIEEPNSLFATLCSFFPPSTPMLMLARQAIPPGPPWWQPPLGIALVLATTLGCVYAAGRIFRVGILMQGKGARMGDLVRWVVRG
jgi:ABC-2 type transport system permease protein